LTAKLMDEGSGEELFGNSSASTAKRQRTLEAASTAPRPSLATPEVHHAKNRWFTKLFRRKAKSMVSLPNAGLDFNRRTPPTKDGSEASVMSNSLNNIKLPMTPILENKDSPISIVRKVSPEPERLCACKGEITDARHPEVISFASCSNGQAILDGPEGISVTQALIAILEKNPHPTYHKLMKDIRYWLHDQAQQMLRFYTNRKKYRESLAADLQRQSTVINEIGTDLRAIMESANNRDEDYLEAAVVNSKPVQEPMLGSENLLDFNQRLFL